jgi:hypothetical protein
MPSWKLPANVLLYGYFWSCLNFLENALKWLAEEMIQLLGAPNLISCVLLELSTLCWWKETCDIECWGLRTRLSEYSFFLPSWGLEIVWWKQTVYLLSRTKSMSVLWLTLYLVQSTAATWQVASLLQICAWIVSFRLVWIYWKTLWNG